MLRWTPQWAADVGTETLSDSLVQKLGDDPLHVARLVEEALASPHLYARLGVAAPVGGATDAGTPGGTDAGTPVTTVLLMASGERLAAGASKQSSGFTFINQLDGNLVLYRTGGAPVWAASSSNPSPGNTSMQGDGNLVVYDSSGQPQFNTGTHNNPGATLHLDPAGRLLIKAPDGRSLWSSTGVL